MQSRWERAIDASWVPSWIPWIVSPSQWRSSAICVGFAPAVLGPVNNGENHVVAFETAEVFFLTEGFVDEKYLAAEIDYAIMQKRRKGTKFAVITLRYSNNVPIPGLLTPYVYRDVANDLEGFTHLIAALPIELGPVRWKISIV